MRLRFGCGSRGRLLGRLGILLSSFSMIVGALVVSSPGGAAGETNRAAVYGSSPFTWSGPEPVDAAPPYGNPYSIDSISCATASLCMAAPSGSGKLLLSTSPTGESEPWSTLTLSQVTNTSGTSATGVSCVQATSGPFCLATTNSGLLTSTSPTGGAGAWSLTKINAAGSVQPECSVSGLTTICIVGTSSNMWVSLDPTGGASSWTKISPGFGSGATIVGVACPSTTTCVAVSSTGYIVESADPTDTGSWSSPVSTPFNDAKSMSCPTTTFCEIEGGYYGLDPATSMTGIETTADIEDGASATWTTDSSGALAATYEDTHSPVSCSPDAELASPHVICMFTSPSSGDNVEVSTDGGGSWSDQPGGSAGRILPAECSTPNGCYTDTPVAFACPAHGVCVGGTSGGGIIASTNATSGASGTWSVPYYPAGGVSTTTVTPASCPSAELCLASDNDGRVLTTTDVAADAGSWNAALIAPGEAIKQLECPSSSLCVALDAANGVFISTDPAAGASSWSGPDVVDLGGGAATMQCPSVALCVMSDENHTLVSTNPAAGASSWSESPNIDTALGIAGFVDGLQCPSANLCLAFDDRGNILTSTDPGAGSSSWTATNISPSGTLYGLSCASASLCVARDGESDIFTSTNPAGGASAWSGPVNVDAGQQLQELTCPSDSLCLATDGSGDLLTSTNPTGGASAWSAPTAVPGSFMNNLECPSASLCVSLLSGALSDDPAGGASTWTLPGAIPESGSYAGTGDALPGIACPSSELCIESGYTGDVFVGTTVAAAPVEVNAPSISGTAQQDDTLSEVHGSWTNSPASYTYQWEDCDDAGQSCTPISGATGQTYTLAATDVGHTIVVVETASNAGGSGTPAASAPTAVVQAAGSGGSQGSGGGGPAGSGGSGDYGSSAGSGGSGSGGGSGSSGGSPAGATPSTATPTSGQIKAALNTALKSIRGKAAKIPAIHKAKGFKLKFKAPSTGRLVIDWYAKVGKKKQLIGSATTTSGSAKALTIKLKLTATGRRLLKTIRSLKVTETASFTPTGGKKTTITRTLTLKH